MTECLNDFNIQILTNILQLLTSLLVLTTALISKNGMSLKIVKNDRGSRFRKKESTHEQTWDLLMKIFKNTTELCTQVLLLSSSLDIL